MRFLFCLFIIISLGCTAADQTQEKETFVDIKGHQIHTKTAGEGPPVVLAHGGYLNLDMWEPQVDAFRQNHTLIRFSDLGHGASKRGDQDIYGYEIIHHLLEGYPGEKATLIGLSWGAMLSVDYTLNYPERVDKLILVSPGLNGWDYFQDSIANQNYQLRRQAVENADTLTAARLFHKTWVVGPRRNPDSLDENFHNLSLQMIRQTMADHWLEDWSNLDTLTAIDRLDDINVPTYIIIGDQDAEDILLIADAYEKNISKARKVVIRDAAHLLNMEHPKKFNTIIKSILAEK